MSRGGDGALGDVVSRRRMSFWNDYFVYFLMDDDNDVSSTGAVDECKSHY